MEHVKPVKVIVYDFETTGFLDMPEVQPTELAAMIIDVDGSVKTIHKYVTCPYPLSPKIIELTGITDGKLEDEGYPLGDVIGEFEYELRKAETGTHCIVGHNILTFDNPLYGMMQEKLGGNHKIDPKKCFDTGGQFKGELMKWKKFDNLSHHDYQRKCMEARSYVKWNLTAAGKHYGIKSSGVAHSAIGDIENNLQVFIKQLKQMGKIPENLVALEMV